MQRRSTGLVRALCACAAWLAIGCPAAGRAPGPTSPGGPGVGSADAEKSERDDATLPPDLASKRGVVDEISVDDDADKEGFRSGASTGKLDRPKKKRAKEEKLSEELAEEKPAVRQEVSTSPSDSLAALDLNEAQRDALVAPRLERARKALAGRDFDKAIAELRPVFEVESDNVDALLLMARAYLDKGWLPKARRILETATKSGKGAGSARLWMMLGLVHERSGNELALARDAYAKATKLKPNYAKAWTNLGATHLELGDYEAAVAALETALSIESESVVALTNMGTAYRRHATQLREDREKRDELVRKAENAYRSALAVDESYAPAHFDLGLLYLDTNGFPGREDADRLRLAVRHLREYERLLAEGAVPRRGAPAVNEYLESAQQALDRLDRAGRARP